MKIIHNKLIALSFLPLSIQQRMEMKNPRELIFILCCFALSTVENNEKNSNT